MAVGTADEYIRLPDGSLKRNPASLSYPLTDSIEKEQGISLSYKTIQRRLQGYLA